MLLPAAAAGIPACRPGQAVSSSMSPDVALDAGHPGRPVAYVWVSRCDHTGKPKHISWQGRLPGGPWPHAGCGRVFNHAPRTRRAAKSSYSQTKPISAQLTALAIGCARPPVRLPRRSRHSRHSRRAVRLVPCRVPQVAVVVLGAGHAAVDEERLAGEVAAG